MIETTWRNSGLTSRTPAKVLRNTRKNTISADIAIFDSMPMPNQRMSSGASAILGMQ